MASKMDQALFGKYPEIQQVVDKLNGYDIVILNEFLIFYTQFRTVHDVPFHDLNGDRAK